MKSFTIVVIFVVAVCGAYALQRRGQDIEQPSSFMSPFGNKFISPYRPKEHLLVSPGWMDITDDWCDEQLRFQAEGDIKHLSVCLHLLMYYGLNAKFNCAGFSSSEDILEILLSSKRAEHFFGSPLIVETPYGLRFRTLETNSLNPEYGLESHRDQTLASLARIGVPFSQKVIVEGSRRDYSLANVLDDSMSNFTASQGELAWSLEAYLLYLAPLGVVSWDNRIGEHITLDFVVQEIINRPIAKASCGGAHHVYVVAIALQVDSQFPFLTPETRKDSQAFLADCVGKFVAAANSSGGGVDIHWFAFDSGESRDPESKESVSPNTISRLIGSGHWAEILKVLPDEFSVTPDVEKKLLGYLLIACRNMNKGTPAIFCPIVHSLGALRHCS